MSVCLFGFVACGVTDSGQSDSVGGGNSASEKAPPLELPPIPIN